jgi:hypothetical protein
MVAICLLLTVSLAQAAITVYRPQSLRDEIAARHKDGQIPSALSSFGYPPYGSKMIGKVYLPVHKTENKACDPLTPLELSEDDIAGNEGGSSPIVLVNRGKCGFVTKVRHAQDIGAKAVLIVDDQSEVQNLDNELLYDDTGSADIGIPSFLITKTEGELIRQSAKSEEVVLILAFDPNSPTQEFIDVTFWMSSGSNDTLSFLTAFAPTALSFPPQSFHFHPHHVLWYCTGCKAGGFQAPSPNCLSGGRYCAPDPDGNGPLEGRAIVYEDLRQICVYQLTGDKGVKSWFEYVSNVYQNCFPSGLKEECANNSMKGIVNKDDVKKCVHDSFLGTDPTVHDNGLLKAEKALWLKKGPSFFPSIQINNATFRGDLHPVDVSKALCSAFNTPPPNCVSTITPNPPPSGLSFGHMVVTVILVLGVLLGVLLAYRLWMRREMQGEMKRQVTAAVSQYVALNDERRGRRG